MDYYDQIIVQLGADGALSIAVDDARKLRRRLRLTRLIAATAAAVELIRQGCKIPQYVSRRFERGWSDLLEEMRLSSANQLCDACDAVRLIAEIQALDSDAKRYINQARRLKRLLWKGLIPPDPAPSEDYECGWEAACKAFRHSCELCALWEALDDAEEEYGTNNRL